MTDIITGALVIAAIGAVLALLLEIAASYITDYGERHILINEKKDLVVTGGSPLLFTLMNKNIFVPSACGGKGTCAECKVRVMEGGGPLLPTETPYLDKEELENNVRLACQVKVKEDTKIEIDESLFLIHEFRVRVEKIEELTPDIKGIDFMILSPEEGITFKSGQYVQLQIPPYKLSRTAEYRAYSIASSAEDHQHIKLVIAKVEGGIVSTYVHDYLKEGDEVTIRGPFGEFFLRESHRDILLIATGSGLAPIMSILHQIERENIVRKAILFFGDRRPHDIYFREQISKWEKTMDHFTFIPVLSRTTEEDRWEGEKGRVTDLIQKYIPDNDIVDVYLCGSLAMVDTSAQLLRQKGIPEASVFFDKFE
jgi:Na+-transporting NADH:ubiquinone oxidoreductase subunit F